MSLAGSVLAVCLAVWSAGCGESLPEVLADAYAAQNQMRRHARQATTMICLATQLHSIASGNMTLTTHGRGLLG
mgnify:CR=1 FL=1